MLRRLHAAVRAAAAARAAIGRTLVFFPGSTIGNFEPVRRDRFLARLAALAGPDGDAAARRRRERAIPPRSCARTTTAKA